MELFLARPAEESGQLVVCAVDDIVTDITLLQTLKLVVDVLLPEGQRAQQRRVAVG